MKIFRGTIEDKIIRLEEPTGLPDGTKAFVKVKPFIKEKQDKIIKRQLELLEKGFDMGELLVKSRDEIYER